MSRRQGIATSVNLGLFMSAPGLSRASQASGKKQLLAQSWTGIAQAYSRRVCYSQATDPVLHTPKSYIQSGFEQCRELVPRFMPWIQQTVQNLFTQLLPSGAVIVPGCGSGTPLLLKQCTFDAMLLGTEKPYR